MYPLKQHLARYLAAYSSIQLVKLGGVGPLKMAARNLV